jgi:23S rRNA maturation mini-RNase III
VSLLLSEGHRDARRYPVAVVWSEANIVRQRNSARRYRDSAITQQVLGTLFSKKAGKELQKLLREVAESD